MNREQEVTSVMQTLVVATDKDVGEVMAARGHWSAGQSARVNAGKILKKLSELGQIERCEGFWRIHGCRSDFKGHSRMLTRVIVDLIKLEGKNEG